MAVFLQTTYYSAFTTIAGRTELLRARAGIMSCGTVVHDNTNAEVSSAKIRRNGPLWSGNEIWDPGD